jgi:serine/threonine protein kinase
MDVQWTPPRAKADPNIRIAYVSDVRMADDTGRVLCRRFELLAPIGAGATAAVYRALDRETKSHVAIKVLYKGLRGDAEALRYFAQEGRLAARIVHPHLLRAHYYGQRNGTPFIVFELVPGESLTQVAAMRPMPWRRLGMIVLQVLDALAKLHEECVLHGDIQPDNVIVQQTTLGQDFAKVIDLGFASARGCSRLTLAPEPPSEIHGTPGFIAPERLAGLEPDARADLYSVGALMYFPADDAPGPRHQPRARRARHSGAQHHGPRRAHPPGDRRDRDARAQRRRRSFSQRGRHGRGAPRRARATGLHAQASRCLTRTPALADEPTPAVTTTSPTLPSVDPDSSVEPVPAAPATGC